MPRKLPDYLWSERRRVGLSQEDVARLLAARVLTVRRYEQRKRLPPLETALAYEAIFGRPISELFHGRYQEIRRRVRRTARWRANNLREGRNTRMVARRKESLELIATR